MTKFDWNYKNKERKHLFEEKPKKIPKQWSFNFFKNSHCLEFLDGEIMSKI